MDYFMDLNEGVGNDLDRVEQGCHSVVRKAKIPAAPTSTLWTAARVTCGMGPRFGR